mmetsp:Transcript_35648/g.26021  ORF Transcript_35648/g.26021 Transcript_35648/m.26021 type:complete len:164 (+) Transcript_35648:918-1409(+)
MQIEPNHGPQSSETQIVLKGYNFYPFKDMLHEIDNKNDTWCVFIKLNLITPAIATNSTRVTCIAPRSPIVTVSEVELALNYIEATDNGELFYWYKTPILYSIEPREGPTSGDTTVRIIGAKFPRDAQDIKCKFDKTTVKAEFISPSEVECVSPKHHTPEIVDL